MASSTRQSIWRRPLEIWLIASLLGSALLGAVLVAEPLARAREVFLPGRTSDAHYQIELDCGACHKAPFGGASVMEEACIACHGEELGVAKDSHPKTKFTDPRNADRVQKLDARSCITCHGEHMPGRTGAMGVTLPVDYCFRCHSDIAEERPSHQGVAFDACASSGCHNYHDNRALYEDFLVKHGDEGVLAPTPGIDAVEASACPSGSRATLSEQTKVDSCRSCHERQTSGWLASRHGMRVRQGLAPMTPSEARLPMREEAAHRQLGCVSCHDPRQTDPLYASVRACQGCHSDEHTKAYEGSRHYELTQNALLERVARTASVTCATCHLPASEDENGSRYTEHNQNDNLRPQEKMIRSVCLECHGLAFSLDALADVELARNNYSTRPSRHIESIDWAKNRDR